MSRLFFLFFFVSLFLLSRRLVGADRESDGSTVSCNPNAAVWLIAAGIASFPFLPFDHLVTMPVTPVPSSKPTDGFSFPHITCLQEI